MIIFTRLHLSPLRLQPFSAVRRSIEYSNSRTALTVDRASLPLIYRSDTFEVPDYLKPTPWCEAFCDARNEQLKLKLLNFTRRVAALHPAPPIFVVPPITPPSRRTAANLTTASKIGEFVTVIKMLARSAVEMTIQGNQSNRELRKRLFCRHPWD